MHPGAKSWVVDKEVVNTISFSKLLKQVDAKKLATSSLSRNASETY
jgi:hypothetical protein